MSRISVIAIVAFAVSAAATYAVVFFAAWQVLDVVDTDGGGSMGLAFVIAPAVAVIGGVAGVVVAGVRAQRLHRSATVGTEERHRDASRLQLAIGVLAGGLAGYLMAKSASWLAGPVSYDVMWKALVHAWAPMLATVLGAAMGGLLTRSLRF